MTKKLEEELNLPAIEDMLPENQQEEVESTAEAIKANIVEYQSDMGMLERVDTALPTVEGLQEIDREMDQYAQKAMDTFDDLVDLGKNVEDRHAAPIFDSAAKMITAALQAKTAKLDKKMKMLELQQRQHRLEKESEKIDAYVAARKKEIGIEDPESIEGTLIGDRTAMLNEIMKNIKEKDK